MPIHLPEKILTAFLKFAASISAHNNSMRNEQAAFRIPQRGRLLMFFRFHFFRLRRVTACIAALIMSLCGTVQFYAHSLPDHFYTDADRPISVATALPVTFSNRTPSVPHGQEAELRLFGMFPVKTVSLTPLGPANVWVGGEPFGIRMLMDGVLVIPLTIRCSTLPRRRELPCPKMPCSCSRRWYSDWRYHRVCQWQTHQQQR